MESSEFNDLLNNLKNKEEIEKSQSQERLCPKEVHKKFKDYYYEVSHDEYYAAKRKLDDNVLLKKELRKEMEIIQELKNLVMLNNEQKAEVKRINQILEDANKVPDKNKIAFETIKEIEEKLDALKAFLKE